MRFGNWQGVALAFAVSSVLAAGSARADWFTIPREVTAVNVNTGGPYFAPPIPYGCYTKDHLGAIQNGIGLAKGSLFGIFHRGNGACGGAGCNSCGGAGCGDPAPAGCHACGGSGCGFCQGLGLFRGHGHKDLCGTHAGHASTIIASGQGAPVPSAQSACGVAGCGLLSKHSHFGGRRFGRPCGSCGGAGCGACGGGGFFPGGDPCGNCGGAGCGLCAGALGHGSGCNACGGRGCRACSGARSLLGLPHALVNKVLHRGEIKYFVGPGGPVPITPGYVPYVVTTRSPRDFLAFPPFVE